MSAVTTELSSSLLDWCVEPLRRLRPEMTPPCDTTFHETFDTIAFKVTTRAAASQRSLSTFEKTWETSLVRSRSAQWSDGGAFTNPRRPLSCTHKTLSSEQGDINTGQQRHLGQDTGWTWTQLMAFQITCLYVGFSTVPPMYPLSTLDTPMTRWKTASTHQKHPVVTLRDPQMSRVQEARKMTKNLRRHVLLYSIPPTVLVTK